MKKHQRLGSVPEQEVAGGFRVVALHQPVDGQRPGGDEVALRHVAAVQWCRDLKRAELQHHPLPGGITHMYILQI